MAVAGPTNDASGMRALEAATGGSICVMPKRLPPDFAELTAALRDPSTRVQLIARGPRPSDRTELVSAPIEIPALSARRNELDRIIDEFAGDAAAAMAGPLPGIDRDWARRHCAASLPEIERGVSRIIALRRAGTIAGAAALLGMAHASLGEWVGCRRLSARYPHPASNPAARSGVVARPAGSLPASRYACAARDLPWFRPRGSIARELRGRATSSGASIANPKELRRLRR